MTCATNPSVRDRWLLPVLVERLPIESLEILESKLQGSYWETAVRESLFTDDDLVEAVSTFFGIEVADVSRASKEAREKVPETLARRFSILPLSITDSTLRIATADPLDIDCEKTLAFATSRRVVMSLCAPRRILERIDELYGPPGIEEKSATGSDDRSQALQSIVQAANGQSNADDDAERPGIRLVDQIVAGGIAQGPSGIRRE